MGMLGEKKGKLLADIKILKGIEGHFNDGSKFQLSDLCDVPKKKKS